MRLVLYTSEAGLSSETFSYIYAHLSVLPVDIRVVAVKGGEASFLHKLKRKWRKFFRLGFCGGMEVLSSMPIQMFFDRRDGAEISRGIRALPRPDAAFKPGQALFVADANGAEAAGVIKSLQPDILLQAGAGILRPQIFNIPRLGTLNMHHGIAPAVRGMNSIYWALWENRPEWIGATIHLINEGLDTGRPLAYFPVTPVSRGEGFASLFVRATQGGVVALAAVIQKMLDGEQPKAEANELGSVYRSTFSGWKRALLEYRLSRQKRKFDKI